MATKVAELAAAPIPATKYGSLAWFRDQIEAGKDAKSIFPVTITPRIASQLLQLNTKNRNIKPVKVEQFRRAIRAGHWQGLNGETIKIKADGVLGDGQNRLTAAYEEGADIQSYVMFGATDADIRTVDQGAARTAGDVIKMEGVESAIEKAAIARLVIAFEASGGTSIQKSNRVSNSEIILRVARDDFVSEATAWAMAHRAPGIPASAVGFLWYHFAKIHREDADHYLSQVCRGINLKENDPAARIREYLINRVRDRHRGRDKKIEALMRGWNAFRERRVLGGIVTNGALPELV